MQNLSIQKKRKFAFLYLDTGNGHIAQAKVLKSAMNEIAPDISVELIDGFSKKNHIARFIFEKMYGFLCNNCRFMFALVYEICQMRFVLAIVAFFISRKIEKQLKQIINDHEITDIVSFHFLLTPGAKRIVESVDRKINLTVVCTDPFTGPNAWFYNKGIDCLVASQQMKQTGINFGLAQENLHVVPFLLNSKYRERPTEEEKKALKEKFGFTSDKKIILLAGGGEGLSCSLKIINQCFLHKSNFTIITVCGRNKSLKKTLDVYAKLKPSLDLHVFGFVDFMDSLIKISDIVVSKAGASSVFEIISSHKPLIINRYIHNQELGNMQYIVNNNIGFYIKHSNDIFKKINQILSTEESYNEVVNRFKNLRIDTDTKKVAEYILNK